MTVTFQSHFRRYTVYCNRKSIYIYAYHCEYNKIILVDQLLKKFQINFNHCRETMALRGIKVLEFAGLAPGPYCGERICFYEFIPMQIK